MGRKVAPSNNHTNTNFKSKTLNVREQSVVANKNNIIVSSRNLSLTELISKLAHHNAGVRKEAVEGILDILIKYSTGSVELKSKLSGLVAGILIAIGDEEKQVRVEILKVLKVLFEMNYGSEVHWFTPFIKLYMFHVFAGLSSLQLGVRLDCMSLVDLTFEFFPHVVVDKEAELLPLYSAVLATSLDRVGSRHSSSETNAITSNTGGILRSFKQSKSSGPNTKNSSELWFRVAESYSSLVRNMCNFTKNADLSRGTSARYTPLLSPAAKQEEQSDTIHQAVWRSTVQSVLTLWIQSFTSFKGACDSSRGRIDQQRVCSTLLQIEMASQLLFHILTYAEKVANKAELYSNIAMRIGPSFPLESLVVFENVKNTCVSINTWLANCIFRISSHSEVVELSLVQKVVSWIGTQIRLSSLHADMFPRVLDVALTAFRSDVVTDRSELALDGCFDEYLISSCEENIDLVPVLRAFGFALEHQGILSQVKSEWLMTLPRLCWQYAIDEDEPMVGEVLHLLHVASIVHSDNQCWGQVSRVLSMLLGAKSKTSGEYVQGPFVTHFTEENQLKFLSLISILPVDRMPVALLRGFSFVASTTNSPLIMSRVVAMVFRPLLKRQEEVTDVLGDIISFAISVLWQSSGYNKYRSIFIGQTLASTQYVTGVPVIEVFGNAVSNLLLEQLGTSMSEWAVKLLARDETCIKMVNMVHCLEELLPSMNSMFKLLLDQVFVCCLLLENKFPSCLNSIERILKCTPIAGSPDVVRLLTECQHSDQLLHAWIKALGTQKMISNVSIESSELKLLCEKLAMSTSEAAKDALIAIRMN